MSDKLGLYSGWNLDSDKTDIFVNHIIIEQILINWLSA